MNNQRGVLPDLPKNFAYSVGPVLVAALLVFLSTTEVGPGQRGVVMDFGAVQQGILQPGLHFVIPVMQSVTKINVRIQKFQVEETAASKDLQDVSTQTAINFHIEPQDVNWVYQHVGNERAILRGIVAPSISNVVKAVTAHYNAEDLIVERDQVRDQIEAMLRQTLSKFRVAVDAVNITNFRFSPEFAKAIEQKQVSQQRALQAQYELQRAQVQAQQTVVTARADAEAMRLKQTSVSPEIIELEAVNKWNGILPTYLGSRGLFSFLNIGQK